MTPTEHRALTAAVDKIAADLGRLRRTTTPNTSAWWAIDRIAQAVETIDCINHPSAAELHKQGDSIQQALQTVDNRARKLRELTADTDEDRAQRRALELVQAAA